MAEDNILVEMYDWSCCTCGAVQKMTRDMNDFLRKTHHVFYCVHGHQNVYNKKTDIEELNCKLTSEYAKNAQLEGEIRKLQKITGELREQNGILIKKLDKKWF